MVGAQLSQWAPGCPLRRALSIMGFITSALNLSEQLAAAGAPVPDSQVALRLLCSLPKSYGGLVTALDSQPGELSLDFVVSRLQVEEVRRRQDAEQRSMDEALIVTARRGWLRVY